jgi:glycosyltransferase involved in cell wall biosynthesis
LLQISRDELAKRRDTRASPVRRPRVLISQQGCIPIYRKSFFERLNKSSNIEFVVVHGHAPTGSDIIEASPPYDFPNIKVENREFCIFGRAFIWQPVVAQVIAGAFDGAVIGEEIKYFSNIVIALAMRLRQRPTLLWGFGYHQYDRAASTWHQRAISSAVTWFKRVLYRRVSGYLVYTESGEKALRSLGMSADKISVLRNTVDTEREAKFRDAVAQEPIEQILTQLCVRPDTIKLLYFGRLVPMKHVDLLAEYARRCAERARKVDVIIFGKGAEESRLRKMAADLNNVSFHRHDDYQLARALRVSSAVVIPGYVGLAVTHAFAHGVPVLTRLGQMHSPEVEYVEDGVNGLMLPDEVEAFFSALDTFVDDLELQKRLSAAAIETAKMLEISYMVNTFREFVQSSLIRSP